MDLVVARISRWLEANSADTLTTLQPGASDDELAAAEKALGVTLPDGMRALYRWRNGATGIASFLGNRMLMPLAEIVSTRAMMSGLVDRREFKTTNWWRKTWVPFLSNGAGDHLCLDPRGSFSGEPGQVIEFWHTDHDRKVLAPSFDGWLTSLIDSLEAGLWRLDPEEGLVDDGQFEPFLTKRFPGYPRLAIDRDGKRPGRAASTAAPKVDADLTRPVKPYAIATKYEAGDRVEHPTLGTGVVQRAEQTKIDVLFPGGARTLVHAKGSESGLAKPKPVDHTTGARKV